MKLLRPHVPYRQHMRDLVNQARPRVPALLPPVAADVTATILALVWPVLVPIAFVLCLLPARRDLALNRNTRYVQATAFLHKEYEPAFFWWEFI